MEGAFAELDASSDRLLQGPERSEFSRSSRAFSAVTASANFFDAIGDNEGGLAPDLQQMVVLTEDDGYFTVGIRLNSNALIDGDFVATFVNTDGDAATGSATFGGADLAIGIVGQTGTDAVAASRWNGVAWQATPLPPSLVSFPDGATDEVWLARASELGIAPGTTTTLVFGALYEGTYDTYSDFAPEPGFAPFAFPVGALSPPAPPPPPPPPPAPVVAPPLSPTPIGGTGGAPATRPLVVRSFAVRKLPRAVRVRIGWTRGEGRVVWNLRLTAKVNGRRVAKRVRGAGQAGLRTVNRTVRLPARWKRTRLTARLTVKNGSRTITRTRVIRL